MFSTRLFSLQPALNLDMSKLYGLENLARQTLDLAGRARHDLTPVLRRARLTSNKALDLAAKTARQAVRMVETQVLPRVQRNLGGPRPAVSPAILQPIQGEIPARDVRPGPLMTVRLTLQLLCLAVAEKARAAAGMSPAKPKSPWLISKNDDLIYMIGSSAVSYLFMALIFIFKVKPSTVFWIYVLFFDGPHIFGTFSRTYADPEEWQKRRKLFLGSLLLFLPGPLAVRLGLGDYFDIFAYMWAYFHLVKQHYGFSILYKKKNNDLAKIDNYLDKALIWTGFTLPYVNFVFGPNYPTGYKRVADILPGWTPKLAGAAFFTTLAAYLSRQAYKLATHQKIDAPKQMLLASSITMHMVTFRLPFAKLGGGLSSLAPIVAILTVYHNIQYNRLIWFHNQNKYVKGAKNGQTFGLASTLSRDGKRFALVAFLFGASYRIPLGTIGAGMGVSPKMARYITAFGWGFAFVHYYLDSKIWRVRHDQRLGSALKVNSAPAAH
jgi:hypothetical protein